MGSKQSKKRPMSLYDLMDRLSSESEDLYEIFSTLSYELENDIDPETAIKDDGKVRQAMEDAVHNLKSLNAYFKKIKIQRHVSVTVE